MGGGLWKLYPIISNAENKLFHEISYWEKTYVLGDFCLFYEPDDSCQESFQENKSFIYRVSINFTFKMAALQENTI